MTFKDLLVKKGMSGYQFAKKAQIHQPAVSKFVTGKRDPLGMSLNSAARAAAALDMTIQEFYDTLKK